MKAGLPGSAAASTSTRVLRLRRAFLWLHRWLGLGFGVILVLVSVTGSFIVFYREIDAALNLALYTPAGPEHRVTAEEVMHDLPRVLERIRTAV